MNGRPYLAGELALGRTGSEGGIGPVELEPAVLAQVVPGAGFGEQCLMLGQRTRKQGPHALGELDPSREGGAGAVGEQPGNHLRKKGQMVVGLGRAPGGHFDQRHQSARERVRQERISLDHTGIPVGRLLTGRSAIEQHNGDPALGEMQGNRGADDPGPQHDDVDSRHGDPFPKLCAVTCMRGRTTARAQHRAYPIWGVRRCVREPLPVPVTPC